MTQRTADSFLAPKRSAIGVGHGAGLVLAAAESELPPEWPRRFRSKITVQADGCWIWTACRDRMGYGRYSRPANDVGPRVLYAHRHSYELTHGPIAPGLIVDHLCRVTSCVRPDHLEAITHVENVRRGDAANADGFCRRGLHAWTGENIYVELDGTQRCRPCRNATERAQSRGIASRLRTHCPNDHEYDAANTRIRPNGNRECRACHRDRKRARHHARKAEGEKR